MIRRIKQDYEWDNWYAWYPIIIGDYIYWRENVLRRRETFVSLEGTRIKHWVYQRYEGV